LLLKINRSESYLQRNQKASNAHFELNVTRGIGHKAVSNYLTVSCQELGAKSVAISAKIQNSVTNCHNCGQPLCVGELMALDLKSLQCLLPLQWENGTLKNPLLEYKRKCKL